MGEKEEKRYEGEEGKLRQQLAATAWIDSGRRRIGRREGLRMGQHMRWPEIGGGGWNLWRSVVNRAGANRQFVTATAPRRKPVAAPADFMQQGEQHASKPSKGEFIPVYVALGLILLSMSCGAYTAKQQIAYNPSVRVSKKRRESVPEVEDPDRVLTEADKFINKSLFRKVAHVQDFDAVRAGISDSARPDPFRAPRRAETLNSVGVSPRGA